MDTTNEKLTLIPSTTPNAVRQNERRIEEFIRAMLASQKSENSSYARRFLTMD